MKLEYVRDVILKPAYLLLPTKMRSPEADVMLLTIGQIESRWTYRSQLIGNRHWWEGVKGPARGYEMFELAGVIGVLEHRATRDNARDVCDALNYPARPRVIHRALTHNDTLAACFARLLLWTDPFPLERDHEWGYRAYLRTWRPGKPQGSVAWNNFWQHSIDEVYS